MWERVDRGGRLAAEEEIASQGFAFRLVALCTGLGQEQSLTGHSHLQADCHRSCGAARAVLDRI